MNHTRLLALLLACGFLLLRADRAVAQSAEGRVAVGGYLGLAQYYGGFSDGSPGYGGDLFLRWNLLPQLSLLGQFGGWNLRYGVDDELVANYPEYFGAPQDQFYPGTSGLVRRDPSNTIGLTTYGLLASWNFRTEERLVPFLFAGLGVMTFNPVNSDQGMKLPNNLPGSVYKNTQVMIPFGVGAEWYLTPNLTLNARGEFHFTATDYLDDYKDGGASDAFASLSLGVGYYIFGTLDCDKDGLSDREEKRVGTDPCRPDTDGDGLTDIEEVRRYGTDPLQFDTDGDRLKDADEVRTFMTNALAADSDNDGLNDGDEVYDRRTNPLKADTDDDGLNDGEEVRQYMTDPLKVDTDGDGLSDREEVKSYRTDPLKVDTDGDELNDRDEVITHGTDPLKADTDGDTLGDREEIETWRTNPLKADTDGDRLADGTEIQKTKTDPNDPDSDDDSVIDGEDACPLVRGVRERNGCPAPPKVGTITDFPAVYFIVNTDEFDFSRTETTESLAKIMSYVNQCPGLRVLIEGHASREGSDQRNRTLSEMRAERVRQWLIEGGVLPEKIEGTIGYGSGKNAVTEPAPDSEEARRMDPDELEGIRRMNRRIAIRVVRTCD